MPWLTEKDLADMARVIGGVCLPDKRACDSGCEIASEHCQWWHQPNHKRGYHDPERCDREWGSILDHFP
jgi:hypothetical protein